MQSNTWILVGCVLMMVVFSTCQGKTLYLDDEDVDDSGDLEISQAVARAFLGENSDEDIARRAQSTDCVLCKFNSFRCCKPSICVKKRFRPDECMEVKGKWTHPPPTSILASSICVRFFMSVHISINLIYSLLPFDSWLSFIIVSIENSENGLTQMFCIED